MQNFDYAAPTALGEVLELVRSRGKEARLLAGGTDLIINMRHGRRNPALVIDVKKVPALTEISLRQGVLSIGAAVSCRRIWEDKDIQRAFPALIDSCTLVGSTQIQGRASLGGNLCNSAPSGDVIPTLIAYGAIAHVRSTQSAREVPVESFCTGPGKNVLKDDEILTRISLSIPPADSGAQFLRFIPRNEMDIAVASAAAYVKLNQAGTHFESARIAIGAVAPVPLMVHDAGSILAGKEVGDESIRRASGYAREAASPIDDMRGTVAHRLQLVEVLTTRAIAGAVARARGDQE